MATTHTWPGLGADSPADTPQRSPTTTADNKPQPWAAIAPATQPHRGEIQPTTSRADPCTKSERVHKTHLERCQSCRLKTGAKSTTPTGRPADNDGGRMGAGDRGYGDAVAGTVQRGNGGGGQRANAFTSRQSSRHHGKSKVNLRWKDRARISERDFPAVARPFLRGRWYVGPVEMTATTDFVSSLIFW